MRTRNFISKAVWHLTHIQGEGEFSGVYLNFQKKEAVVTDGVILAIVPLVVPEAYVDCPGRFVSTDFLKRLKELDGVCDIEIGETEALVWHGGEKRNYPYTSAAYVDYHSVLPAQDRSEVAISINPTKLVQLIKALSLEPKEGITLYISTKSPSETVRIGKSTRTVGLLKPMVGPL